MRRLITVSAMTLKMWKSKYGEIPSCDLCEKKFVIGDLVLRVTSNRSHYYHKVCYDEGTVRRDDVELEDIEINSAVH